MGRYSYRMQPTMGVFAVEKLGEALAELIGAESQTSTELPEDWASDSEKLDEWRKDGLAIVEEFKTEFTRIFTEEFRRLLRKVRYH